MPSVRTLADTAAFVLLAGGRPLASGEISFLMKWSGYRFEDVSLEAAIGRDDRFAAGWEPADGRSLSGWKTRLRNPDAVRMDFDHLAVPRFENFEDALIAVLEGRATEAAAHNWPVDELIERWRARADAGLAERANRLRALEEVEELK